jgi:hypothetical protein
MLALSSRFHDFAPELAEDAQVARYVFEKNASGDDEHGQIDNHIRIGLKGVVRKKACDDLEGQPRAANQECDADDRVLSGLQAIESPNAFE